MKQLMIDKIPTVLTFLAYMWLEYKKGLDGKKENSYLELIINTFRRIK